MSLLSTTEDEHQEIVIEGVDDIQSSPGMLFDGMSQVSSTAPTHKTAKLAKLFQTDSCRFGTIEPDGLLHHILTNVCKLPDSFVARMMQVGFYTPHIVVNRFGLDSEHIAAAFGMMGAEYIFPEDLHAPTLHLVAFARLQRPWNKTHPGYINKPKDSRWKKSWKYLKVPASYNQTFAAFTENDIGDLVEHLTDPTVLRRAERLIRDIRHRLREWTRVEE